MSRLGRMRSLNPAIELVILCIYTCVPKKSEMTTVPFSFFIFLLFFSLLSSYLWFLSPPSNHKRAALLISLSSRTCRQLEANSTDYSGLSSSSIATLVPSSLSCLSGLRSTSTAPSTRHACTLPHRHDRSNQGKRVRACVLVDGAAESCLF
jgi:hypothetical protein